MEQQLTCDLVDATTYQDALDELEAHVTESVSFLQAPVYAAVQEMTGKTVVRLVVRDHKQVVGCLLAVKYDGPLGLSFLYAPYGPTVSVWSAELFLAIERFIKAEAKRLGCSFVRLDEFPDDLAAHTVPNKRARAASLQPRAEWVIDLTTEDELWAGMHKHARYNIRLAERAAADVRVFAPAEAPIEDFYSLMKTTGSRDGFSVFDMAYYQSYLSCLDARSGFVIMCYIEDKPAAAGLFVVHDAQAHYVFAGSSDDFRKIAPAYTVIWEALKVSKKLGCTRFNFGGISDQVKGQTWAGVTSFKKRFGGFSVAHSNPVDIATKPLLYSLFALYKSVR